MRIQLARPLLLAATFSTLLLLTPGCRSTSNDVAVFQSSPTSIERKAHALTLVATQELLKKHPNARPKMQMAADDLQIIEAAPEINAAVIQEIIARLPPDTFNDPQAGFYIQAGILFFSDDLGTLAAQNPAQLRSAARGIRLGLEQVLGRAWNP